MRSEQQMYNLILEMAGEDDRIRAVFLNGSRANPKIEKDKYQDYDVVFVVEETASFLADRSWLEPFGTPLIIQEPDLMDVYNGGAQNFSNKYTWLMLFNDGNRIDLRIMLEEEAYTTCMEEAFTVSLLDKDGILPQVLPSAGEQYLVKRPEAGQYRACCNEFFWCLNNLAKGIARDELPYVMEMYYSVIHPELRKMLGWYIGIQFDFSVSTGKMNKYFKKYLPSEIYKRYISTYTDGEYEHIWSAVFNACDLFHQIALLVGNRLGFVYYDEEERNMREYLLKIKHDRYVIE